MSSALGLSLVFWGFVFVLAVVSVGIILAFSGRYPKARDEEPPTLDVQNHLGDGLPRDLERYTPEYLAWRERVDAYYRSRGDGKRE